MAGVAKPTDEAVTEEEMARRCRSRTKEVEETTRLIESLMTNMLTATDALGVPLFRENMLSTVWAEQNQHLPCIQDPPGILLYTITGYITKGGVRLPVLRCARGSTSFALGKIYSR